MPDIDVDKPLWVPQPQAVAATRIEAFTATVRQSSGLPLASYAELHRWSVESSDQFWRAVWEACGVIGDRGDRVVIAGESMRQTQWFPDARLNFAENLLRDCSNEEAIVFRGEDKVTWRMSRTELRREVARFAAALRDAGVVEGDRVAAYMPNMPETIVAMLATASIGATFTSASPDFGVQGVLDRFGQTTPKVLVACDGYWYNGKAIDQVAKLKELVPKLPSIARVVVIPYLNIDVDAMATSVPNGVSYSQFVAAHRDVVEPRYARLPFAHPLFIVYSSGTTGVPKCIVHGAGNTLLQHLKEHQLHSDVRRGDRLFYYTTCGWMMWNWLASGLASGATLLLYDGNPFVDGGRILWEYAQAEGTTHFGTSAKYLDELERTGLKPAQLFDLGSIRAILSTGSPLGASSFDYVYSSIKRDVQLSSISGGTDIISCFVLGNPALPVWRGEIQCAGLGQAVEVWNDEGKPVTGEKGELVCTKAFPSMPLGFWGDDSGERYAAAYFERFPGVWCQGDFCEITENGGYVIYGRSDATLNPGGVRIGTAEIYRQVARVPEVVESIVIGQDWNNDVRVVLFVTLKDGIALDAALIDRIKRTIRQNATPRHVPAKILQVTEVPRTKTGKLVELAVRDAVKGERIRNVEALANPEVLGQYRDRPELRE